MAEPTLQQVFGPGATQDATTLTIHKTDFAALGLKPEASNTAESLLVAILLKAQERLTNDAFNGDLNQSVYVDRGFSSFINRGENNTSYRSDQLTVTLAKVDSQTTLNPADY
ncbi:MAG: hypothetical protein AAGF24_08085 [Cyanobacteria bacterium P01_H01_bin.121]